MPTQLRVLKQFNYCSLDQDNQYYVGYVLYLPNNVKVNMYPLET